MRTAGPFSGALRSGTVTILDDGRIVALGGGVAAIWDPEQRQWSLPREAQLQPRRYLHTATAVGSDRIVFAGGLDVAANRSNQQTALSSVTFWRAQQNIWESGPSLLGPRFAHAAVALPDGNMLVIGGASAADRDEPFGPFLGTVERLDDKTTTAGAPMKFARVRHTATVLPDGRVMVIGGLGDDRAVLASVEIYDPTTNTWKPGPPLATARQGHTATVLPDGRVLVAGGADSDDTPVTRAEVWSNELGIWHDAGELLAPRSGHAATLLKGGSVLLSGGVAYGLRQARTLERWNSRTSEWTISAEVPLELRDHHAALLPDGSVLLIGSDMYERGEVALVWLPDEQESQHLDGVLGASLTELEDGRVLLAGGSRRQSASAAVSIYDTRTNRWIAASPMHFARSGHNAVRLPDGRVLVAGGQITDNIRTNSRTSADSTGEHMVPLGEIWNPSTDRWTLTENVSAIVEASRAGSVRAESGTMELHPLRDGSVLRWNNSVASLRKSGEETWTPIVPETRWKGLIGVVSGADGRTYAFRNADMPGRTFPRLEVVWLNMQAGRWEPNTRDYIEREFPAMLALSETEVMVAGGASAVVQILNTVTNKWRYTGWLPVPVRAPSILPLQDGGVMLAGRVMDNEATVICALWNRDSSAWTECGRFTNDAGSERRAPVLRDLGEGQILLVYGSEHALVRGPDGTWVATKLDFPKDNSIPYPNGEGIAYTADLGSVWNPVEKAWVDATDVLFAHRGSMQAVRAPGRRWIFASRGGLLQWQPLDRVLSRLSTIGAPESNLDSTALIDDGCAVLWNNSREISYGIGRGAYAPVMYVRNFAANTWSSGVDAPAAPLWASALVTKDRRLILAGTSRDAFAGGSEWEQVRVSCDGVVALAPAGSNSTRSVYLPTRPPGAPKHEPVSAPAKAASAPDLTYFETWQLNVSSLADSVRRHTPGTMVFGGLVILLLTRLTTRFSVYAVDEDGHAPGRMIDLAIFGISTFALLAALGAPWPGPRTLVLLTAAALVAFAAHRLWTNIARPRDRVVYGVPLGASVVICALAIGSITIGYLSAVIDSLRDY